jgi:hypothetical protein
MGCCIQANPSNKDKGIVIAKPQKQGIKKPENPNRQDPDGVNVSGIYLDFAQSAPGNNQDGGYVANISGTLK